MDFYQSMTTTGQRSYFNSFYYRWSAWHFGARHIAEALHIPYEPTHFEDFRVWTSPTELEMILEHLGYPSDPQLERKRIFREVFTLDKWNNMTAYRVEQPGRPQPAEIPAARRASPRHIPEGSYVAHCDSHCISSSLAQRWQPLSMPGADVATQSHTAI
ncbi:hypothetical protein CK203_112097 [Vitis vinifera]|uniref:Uncharacterized protein n=1 Tax=Vitis vinifera TaxID=29760 RepID=A0A438FEH4_VITVI|nr:hypothetical protein CK203_112097 [Vitis vinifera]